MKDFQCKLLILFPVSRNWGEGWGFMSDGNAVVFIDNHDNQRGHGAGGASIITFWDSRLHKMAVGYMLAHPYGVARVMSSFRWDRHFVNGKVCSPSAGIMTKCRWQIMDIWKILCNLSMIAGSEWLDGPSQQQQRIHQACSCQPWPDLWRRMGVWAQMASDHVGSWRKRPFHTQNINYFCIVMSPVYMNPVYAWNSYTMFEMLFPIFFLGTWSFSVTLSTDSLTPTGGTTRATRLPLDVVIVVSLSSTMMIGNDWILLSCT